MSIEHIYASLNQLMSAVDYLEQEVARAEAEKAKPQPAAKASPKSLPGLPGQNDLFGEWTTPARAANKNAAAALAKRLDNAIDNVQWLLKAGT